jgi:hypothetical protein
LPARIHNLLDDVEQVERRAGEAVDPRYRPFTLLDISAVAHPIRFRKDV